MDSKYKCGEPMNNEEMVIKIRQLTEENEGIKNLVNKLANLKTFNSLRHQIAKLQKDIECFKDSDRDSDEKIIELTGKVEQQNQAIKLQIDLRLRMENTELHLIEELNEKDEMIDDLKEELKAINDSYTDTINEPCTGKDDRVHCTCVPALRQKIKELQEDNAVDFDVVVKLIKAEQKIKELEEELEEAVNEGADLCNEALEQGRKRERKLKAQLDKVNVDNIMRALCGGCSRLPHCDVNGEECAKFLPMSKKAQAIVEEVKHEKTK